MKIVDGKDYLDDIKQLIIEYQNALDRDLSFQSFDDELSNLKGKYTEPNGRILVALCDDGKAVGCVAFHKHSNKRCEMKRLYVKPEYRKLHLVGQLVEKIIETAQGDCYSEMVLDTVKPLQSAIHLYKKYGFYEISPYYNNPMDDVVYMKKDLI